MSTEEQRRQRRQVGAVLAGLVALGAAGIAAGAFLADTPCDDLLPAAPDAAQAAIDVPAVVGPALPDADALEVSRRVLDAGAELGLGPLRGALPSAPVTDLVPFEDGVFAVLDDDLRVVESGLVAVATGRHADVIRRAVPVGESELGIVRSDGTSDDLVARYDEDLRQGACRELEEPGTVVHLDAGVAIVDRGGDVEAVRLDGGSLWRTADLLAAPATDAAVTGLQAIVGNAEEIVAVNLRSGEENWRVSTDELAAPLTDEPILVAGDDLVVVALETGVGAIDGEAGQDLRSMTADDLAAPAETAVATADGVYAVAGRAVFLIDQEGSTLLAELPAPVVDGDQVLAQLDGTLLIATQDGLAVLEDGHVRVDPSVPATALSVSDGYTAVTTSLGDGVTFLFGPVGASFDTTAETGADG